MYAVAALLVLLTGFRSYFSLGQSLLCIGPAFTSYKALKAQTEKNISVSASNSAERMFTILRMTIVFMILIIIQNIIVFYFNQKIWLGLRYMVNPLDDLFSLYLAFMLQRIDQDAGRQAEAAAVADTLGKEINTSTGISGNERIIGEFCTLHKMTGN